MKNQSTSTTKSRGRVFVHFSIVVTPDDVYRLSLHAESVSRKDLLLISPIRTRLFMEIGFVKTPTEQHF